MIKLIPTLLVFALILLPHISYAAWCVYAMDPAQEHKTVMQKCIGSEGSALPLLTEVDNFIQSQEQNLCLSWDEELDQEFDGVLEPESPLCEFPEKPSLTIEFKGV
ncbi:MAG: hypothetical protein AAF202_09255 [Pseudomonadota bacterium]